MRGVFACHSGLDPESSVCHLDSRFRGMTTSEMNVEKEETEVGAAGIMDNNRLDQIIDKHHGNASALIQILLEIQKENRWLPREVLEKVSRKLQVPLSRIQHIVTFYKAFSLVPKGRHQIHICMGTACHVRGAPRVLDTVQDLIGVKPGETDMELKFSLETVNCLGCCALGPVMEVDGRHHGKMAPAEIGGLLKKYE
jgi:NADH-quinone oxidoreductase subunit E